MSEKQFDVVCFGFGCVDVLIEGLPPAEERGEAAIGQGVLQVRSTSVSPGGDALNEATVLSKLSDRVKLVCAVGDDYPSAVIEKRAREVGFDISDLGRTFCGETLLSIVIMDDDGQHTFLSTGFREKAEYEPNWDTLKQGKVVSLASMFVPPLHKPEAVLKAAKTAKEAGAIVCADCGFPKNGKLDPAFLEAFPYVDYFFPNEEEALGITGEKDPVEAARVLRGYGIKNVIVKVGKRGCYLCNDEGIRLIPAYSQVKAVDTTGAGDNFAAGFIHALLRGDSPAACCEFASGVSAICVQHIGASVGVQSLKQVEEAIARFKQGLT